MKLYLLSVAPTEVPDRGPTSKIKSLGALSVATVIERVFPQVDLHCVEGNPDDTADDIVACVKGATHVGFSLYSWSTKTLCEAARILKQRDPNIVLFAGGNDITYYPDQYEQTGLFNNLIIGEGEKAIVQIVEQWLQGETPERRVRVSIPDLSNLPSPWLSKFADLTILESESAYWELSRGCVFHCSYCCMSWGNPDSKTIRFFSRERMLQEIEVFAAYKKVKRISVLEATFNYDKVRAMQILDLLAKKTPNIEYGFEMRPENIDEEFVIHLAKLNHPVLTYGIQSIDPVVLKAVRRVPVDKDHLREIHRLFTKYSISASVDLILGLPNDTFEGFCKSLDFAFSLKPACVSSFTLMVPQVGDLYKDREKWGMEISKEYPNFVLSTSTMSREDIEAAIRISLVKNALNKGGEPRSMEYVAFLEPLQMPPSVFFRMLSDAVGIKATARKGLLEEAVDSPVIKAKAEELLQNLYRKAITEFAS